MCDILEIVVGVKLNEIPRAFRIGIKLFAQQVDEIMGTASLYAGTRPPDERVGEQTLGLQERCPLAHMVTHGKFAHYPAFGLENLLVLILGGMPGPVPVFSQKFHEVGFEVCREALHIIAPLFIFGKAQESRLIVLDGLNTRRYVSSSFHCVSVSWVS